MKREEEEDGKWRAVAEEESPPLDQVQKVLVPEAVFVVAVKSRDQAQALVGSHNFPELAEMKLMVALTPVTKEGRTAFPFAPIWCSTVHKAQGATLSNVAASVLSKLNAPVLYTVMTRVRQLESLFFLYKLAPSFFLTLRFSLHLKVEMKCLQLLQEQTKLHLVGKCQLWSALVPALAVTTL